MEITDNRIDSGKAFDWGRTSREYARYRDIYPDEFYKKIVDRGLCIKGQKVLEANWSDSIQAHTGYSRLKLA